MENTLSLLTLLVAVLTLLVGLFLAAKIKTILYLLKQPVVKKMSPQLRLKPVKLEDSRNGGERREGRDGRNEGRGNREGGERRDGRGENREGREGRGNREGGERRDGRGEGRGNREGGERRDGRGENREGRNEGRGNREGGERREEGRDGEERRGNREGGERRDGRGENREGRNEGRGNREGGERRDGRGEGREGREGRGNREEREAAPAAQPAFSAPQDSPLPARRPLTATSESVPEAREAAPARESSAQDNLFVGSGDSDLQHGRRTQLKKKPRFDLEEGEASNAG